MKPRSEISQEAPPPHQTAGNAINVSFLSSVSLSALKGGFKKRTSVDSTVANTEISLFFVLFFLDRLGYHSPFTDQYSMAPGTHTSQRRCHSTGPHSHPGLPSRHSTSGVGRASDWRRPSGRWNAGGVEVMLLMETKIHIEAYSHNQLGYDVTCSGVHPSITGGINVA